MSSWAGVDKISNIISANWCSTFCFVGYGGSVKSKAAWVCPQSNLTAFMSHRLGFLLPHAHWSGREQEGRGWLGISGNIFKRVYRYSQQRVFLIFWYASSLEHVLGRKLYNNNDAAGVGGGISYEMAERFVAGCGSDLQQCVLVGSS